MNVAVLIPHRPIDEDREANLARTRVQYERLGWTVHACDSGSEQFSRSEAINTAAERAGNADVFFVADNDILLHHERQMLEAASVALRDGCYHLRHLDPDKSRDGEFGNYDLGGRYVAADGDREAILALIGER